VRNLALRLVRLVVVVAIVSFLTFLLLEAAPGDPAITRAGLNASPEVLEEIRVELGLDDPMLVRYARWIGDAARGDLGESYRTADVSASTLVRTALPKTLELMLLAQLMALAVAIPMAVVSARRPGGVIDRLSSAIAFAFVAIPAFVIGIYLTYLFSVQRQWLPAVATDLPSFTSDPLENLRQLFLPALTLALTLVAVYLRLLRTDMVETLQQDYILLAQARGIPQRRLMWRHALRPSTLSLVTAVGLNTGALIGGALVIEILFAIPGMGRLVVDAIFAEDYIVLQAAVLVFTVGYVVVNFVVDLVYFALDPRIRHA
jgi:peptide/nickel transport system permease protein